MEYKPLSINRFSISGVTDLNGVLYTNAIQGSTPAADGLITLTDSLGNVLGGISAAAMTYATVNTWQYDAPAVNFALSTFGGVADLVTVQLVDHANHATILRTEKQTLVASQPSILHYKALSRNRFSLSGGTDQNGVPYTTSNTTSLFTVFDLVTGTTWVNAQTGSAVGGLWVYDATPILAFAVGGSLRVLAQYWSLDGLTLLDTEISHCFSL